MVVSDVRYFQKCRKHVYAPIWFTQCFYGYGHWLSECRVQNKNATIAGICTDKTPLSVSLRFGDLQHLKLINTLFLFSFLLFLFLFIIIFIYRTTPNQIKTLSIWPTKRKKAKKKHSRTSKTAESISTDQQTHLWASCRLLTEAMPRTKGGSTWAEKRIKVRYWWCCNNLFPRSYVAFHMVECPYLLQLTLLCLRFL